MRLNAAVEHESLILKSNVQQQEGSGVDLIPTVEIGGQSDLQEHIFDEHKM